MTDHSVSTPGPENTTILIVEDSPVNQRLLASILGKAGYGTQVACDGEQALVVVPELSPDLILLDVEMPGIDGFQVLAQLAADPTTRSIPVIFLTARSETSDKVRGLELGAVDYITKPFNRSEVLARVRTQVRINSLTRSLIAKQGQLDEDLAAAAHIQRSLIHSSYNTPRGVDVASRFEPCGSIGGDIFNLVRLDQDHLALYVVDVCGHGVPSAMITVSVARSLSIEGGIVGAGNAAGEPLIAPPSSVLASLEKEYPMERFGKYFTISYLVLDLRNGRLHYSSAAHPPPLLVRADGQLERLSKGGSLIGLGLAIPFEQGEVDLSVGDRLFLYTDGIIEHTDSEGREFGSPRLEELLVASYRTDLDSTCDRVMAALESRSGSEPPRDDVTLFAIEYLGEHRASASPLPHRRRSPAPCPAG